MRKLLTICIISSVFGCATPPKVSCTDDDWFDLGRRDANKGLPVTSHQGISPICKDRFQAEGKTLYENGWNRGVLEYCSEKNAFEMGRQSREIPTICPEYLLNSFLKSYEKGRKYSSLVRDNAVLDLEIQTLVQDQTFLSPLNRKYQETEQRLKNLRKLRADNDTTLDTLFSSIQ